VTGPKHPASLTNHLADSDKTKQPRTTLKKSKWQYQNTYHTGKACYHQAQRSKNAYMIILLILLIIYVEATDNENKVWFRMLFTPSSQSFCRPAMAHIDTRASGFANWRTLCTLQNICIVQCTQSHLFLYLLNMSEHTILTQIFEETASSIQRMNSKVIQSQM